MADAHVETTEQPEADAQEELSIQAQIDRQVELREHAHVVKKSEAPALTLDWLRTHAKKEDVPEYELVNVLVRDATQTYHPACVVVRRGITTGDELITAQILDARAPMPENATKEKEISEETADVYTARSALRKRIHLVRFFFHPPEDTPDHVKKKRITRHFKPKPMFKWEPSDDNSQMNVHELAPFVVDDLHVAFEKVNEVHAPTEVLERFQEL